MQSAQSSPRRPVAVMLALAIVLTLGVLSSALADSSSGTLNPGWNLIGPASDSAMVLGNCQARDTTTGQILSLADASIAGWIELPIYFYQGGAYVSCSLDPWDTDTLPPWMGAWCFAHRAGVELILPGTRLSAGYGEAVSLDRPIYYVDWMPPVPPTGPVPPTAYMSLTLFNWTSLPLNLHFCTCQRYDFEIYDSAGRLMWRWSAGKGFCDAAQHDILTNGQRVYTASTPLKTGTGAPYPAGIYKLVGYLTTGCGASLCPPTTPNCLLPFHTARGEITFEVKWIY